MFPGQPAPVSAASVADESSLGTGAVLAVQPQQELPPAGGAHWKFQLELLPEPGRQLLGLVPLPADQRQGHACPPQLLHPALPLDAAVLDQDHPQVPAQRHVVNARLQLQQSLGTQTAVTGPDDHQEASAPRHEGQGVIVDDCKATGVPRRYYVFITGLLPHSVNVTMLLQH